ncbi:phosphotransferase [Cohnella zeiphila]|uniref:Phosphotransferase n=1 Tax=Cohnella zeiphila TaxID=2761120 RepID=A0A7X0SHX1_9BACL|nr:phosphotransferase [Cohnella zeiphila]MBB6730272.1 phosphotransferase [Cohnella zeiphila]
MEEALKPFLEGDSWEIERGEAGWNNTTRFVTARGRKYVLRIYETHRDEKKVRFEHEVLLALAASRLPFAIPEPVRAKDGRTFARIPEQGGKLVCLFAYAEGVRPDSSAPGTARAVGEAVGALSRALASLRPALAPAYPPYYEMDAAHASCPAERIASFCETPPLPFRPLQLELKRLLEELEPFRSALPALRGLPHQLVHGDINDSNLLAFADEPDRIAAVLDFEFCTRDLRAMEPAVVVSGLLDADGAAEAVPAFLEGYARRIRLTAAEADAIPRLVRLRKLDVFVHFLGRYLDGVDGDEVLREQIAAAAGGLAQLDLYGRDLGLWCERWLRPV